jgi:ATP-binding cassette subfamily C protein
MNKLKQINFLISPEDKPKAFIVILIQLISSALEVGGIGLIYSFIGILAQPKLIEEKKYYLSVYKLFGEPPINTFIIGIGLSLIFFYCVKNYFLVFAANHRNNFIFNQREKLSEKLYKSYLSLPYAFHLETNSAELLRNLTEEMNRAAAFSSAMILIASEIITIAAMILLLMITVGIIIPLSIMVIFGLIILCFYYYYQSKIKKVSLARQNSAKQFIKEINQGLGSIKEIKVLRKEQFFTNSFSRELHELIKHLKFEAIIVAVPRLYIETLVFVILILLLLFVFLIIEDRGNGISQASLIALAIFRLMPSYNRILNSKNGLDLYAPSLDVIYYQCLNLKDISSNKREDESEYKNNHEIDQRLQEHISVYNVHYRYPGAKDDSLRGISLHIPKNKAVGIVGSSGAGKTTLVDVLLGLLTPSKGQVLINGLDIQSFNLRQKLIIGYVPQTIYLCDDTLRRNIALGVPDSEIDADQIEVAVKTAQLKDFIHRLPQGLDTITGERGVKLSGGQRQRIGIARALYHNPEILILDEATASLDNQTEAEIVKAMNELIGKKTLIIIAHRMTTVQNCDLIYFLKDGIVADKGKYEELMNNKQFSSMVLGESNNLYF